MRFINLKTKIETSFVAQPTILCLGNFDGVHLGHRQLVDAVIQKQQALKTTYPEIISGAWFFDTNSYKNTDEIYTLEEKLNVFASLGIDYAIIADFNDMKSLSPIDFVNTVLKVQCNCIHAICGENFKFGSKAMGDSQALLQLMDGNATILPLLTKDNNIISSTYIRILLSSGDIQKANYLLSENYSITETVVYGKQLGRMLGIPTINQNIKSKNLILKNGIYATICTVEGKKYFGVTNVGMRPTVDSDGNKNIETYLIDFQGDCYGKLITVEFIGRIRDEIKFENTDDLKAQINKDIQTTKNFFKNH